MNKGSGLTGHSFSPQDIPYVKGNKLDGQESDGLKVKAGAVPELSRNRQSPSDSSPDDQKISRRSVRCADSIKNTYSNGRVRAGLVKEISRALDENRVIKVNDDSQGNKKLKNLNNQLIKVLSELENSTDLSSIGKKFQEKAKEINADNPAEVARIVIDLSFDLIQWHMHGDWLDYDPRAKRLSQIDPELKDILKHFIVDMDKGLVDTDEGYDSEPDLDTEWDRELDVSEPKGQEYRAAKNVVERVQQYWATTEYLEEAKFYPVNIEPDGDNLPASLESVATQTLGTLLVDTNTEIEEGDLPDPERDELNKLRDEASEANQRATEAQDEANQLRTQVQAVQAELNDAKASTSAMTTALSGLQDQLKKVRANSGQVGKKNNTAKSEVDKNQKKIKKLEGEVSSLQHELTTVALEKSKSTLNLQSKNDNLKKENDDLIRRLSETTDEFDKNSLSGQRMVIGDRVQFELSNEKLKSLNEQNKTQHELLEQYTSRLAIAGVDHQSEVNDLRYELENLKQNSEILGGENKILREQASSLEKQLNEVKEKARKAESTAEAKRQLIPQIEINSFAKGEKTGSKTAWEDTGKKIGIYKKEISFLKKERVDLEKQLDDQEKQYRLKLHNNEEEFDDTVRELNSTLEKVQGHLNAKSDEVVDLEQKLEDKGFEFEESQIDQQTQLEEIIDLKEKLKDVRSDHSEALKAESLKVRLEDIERQLTEKSDELAKLSSQNAVINSGY
nr:hypothetical protein [Endozoicomonas sp.]